MQSILLMTKVLNRTDSDAYLDLSGFLVVSLQPSVDPRTDTKDKLFSLCSNCDKVEK